MLIKNLDCLTRRLSQIQSKSEHLSDFEAVTEIDG